VGVCESVWGRGCAPPLFLGHAIASHDDPPPRPQQEQSLEQQRKAWRLERRPAWEIEVRARTYASVDPTPQIAHDLDELRRSAKADLLAWQAERETRDD
jgi:hypothetical protein